MREPRLSEVAAFKRAELARWREADCADLMAAARKEVVEEYENVMPEILMAAREEGRREERERLRQAVEKIWAETEYEATQRSEDKTWTEAHLDGAGRATDAFLALLASSATKATWEPSE